MDYWKPVYYEKALEGQKPFDGRFYLVGDATRIGTARWVYDKTVGKGHWDLKSIDKYCYWQALPALTQVKDWTTPEEIEKISLNQVPEGQRLLIAISGTSMNNDVNWLEARYNPELRLWVTPDRHGIIHTLVLAGLLVPEIVRNDVTGSVHGESDLVWA